MTEVVGLLTAAIAALTAALCWLAKKIFTAHKQVVDLHTGTTQSLLDMGEKFSTIAQEFSETTGGMREAMTQHARASEALDKRLGEVHRDVLLGIARASGAMAKGSG